METVFYILAKSVQICLGIVSFAMLMRMLIPIFFDTEDNPIYAVTCFITEPVIMPVRYVMMKLNIGQSSPIDWSFFTTYLILGILESILPAI